MEIRRIELATKLTGECPCGFQFTTPHGQDDAIAVLMNHVERIHKKEMPKGGSRAEALKIIKPAEEKKR